MMKFDVIYSNPPYSTKMNINIDIKILNSISLITKTSCIIMPAMNYVIKYFNNEKRFNKDEKFFFKSLEYLTDFTLVNSNVFDINDKNNKTSGIFTDQDLCIVKFNFEEKSNELNYVDSISNVEYKMNSYKDLSSWSSYDEDFRKTFDSIKNKLDKWINGYKDRLHDHSLGQCKDVAEKIIDRKINFNEINKDFLFWLPSCSPNATGYINKITKEKNSDFGNINKGTKKQYNENVNFEKSVENLKKLGKNRALYYANNKEEIDYNWNFVIKSPIVKIIFALYRPKRGWNDKIIPWLDKKCSYKDLCNEINFSKEECNFIKDFLSDINVISWD